MRPGQARRAPWVAAKVASFCKCDKRAGQTLQGHMFEIVLVQPEIAPNTGNIMRLAANTGCRLHLVRPLAFSLSDRQLRRAGMDYRAGVDYVLHDDWQSCVAALQAKRIYALTTKGD